MVKSKLANDLLKSFPKHNKDDVYRAAILALQDSWDRGASLDEWDLYAFVRGELDKR